MMKITRQAIALIEMFEGMELDKYKDPAGFWTIGFGHKIEDGEEFPIQISPDEAFGLLRTDLQRIIDAVGPMVTVPINDNQFSALVCFAFNLGPGALKRSTLLKRVNEGDLPGAAAQFAHWTKAGPKGHKFELKGLVRRRAAEELLFRSPVPTWQPSHTVWAGKVDDPEGHEFLANNPNAIVVAVSPTVEEAHGPGAQDAQPNGQGEG